jgi:hypothetical protein
MIDGEFADALAGYSVAVDRQFTVGDAAVGRQSL